MGVVTRFPDGINTELGNSFLADMPFIDPTKFITFFDDFLTYNAADYTITETGLATQALVDGQGGALLITNAAADNDASFSQLNGEAFKFVAGKKTVFKARFKVSDATQSDWVVGLQITDTTPLAVSDGVYFVSADGAATAGIAAASTANGLDSAKANVFTAQDNVFIDVIFYWDGAELTYKMSDGTTEQTGWLDTTSVPLATDLTISYGIQNGEAVAKTMTIDYILAVQER